LIRQGYFPQVSALTGVKVRLKTIGVTPIKATSYSVILVV